jgi:hypothetical protein
MLFFPLIIRHQNEDEEDSISDGCLPFIVIGAIAVVLILFVEWLFATDHKGYTGTFLEFIGYKLHWFVGKLRRLW